MTSILASSGFLTVTDLNDFNDPAQTTNLGVRSSNLFGRAKNSVITGLFIPCYSNVTTRVTVSIRVLDLHALPVCGSNINLALPDTDAASSIILRAVVHRDHRSCAVRWNDDNGVEYAGMFGFVDIDPDAGAEYKANISGRNEALQG